MRRPDRISPETFPSPHPAGSGLRRAELIGDRAGPPGSRQLAAAAERAGAAALRGKVNQPLRPNLSLDIGTRKVVGLLTVPAARGLKIVAVERLEHRTRAMFDGQVHDVAEVAEVVAAVKARLEARCGFPLTEAAVAAAGRSLRTFRGTAVRERPAREPVSLEEARALELEGVQDAQRALAEHLRDQGEARDYLYVGHSVLERRLDGMGIANLVGQRGAVAELQVIATFLPRGVVDSLLAVLERCGLEMTALTLEPIAAIGVVIPPSMRHLNLVLVDIGAGTSDIAITHKGTIIAYDMVPVAGDEITEALSEAYLLDFGVAEQVKRQLADGPQIAFTDILGRRREVPAAEARAALRPAVEGLAAGIAERVLHLNGRPPQAVVLVGGGSLAPGLCEAVAEKLAIPADRVAVRDRQAIQGVTGGGKLLSGPDCVTPIGIAVAAQQQTALGFAYVHVNGAGVRLFHPTRLTVADALLAAGYAARDLHPRLGKGLTITVNGQLRLVKGTPGRPAVLQVNGQPASLDTPVRHRDTIQVVPAAPGEPGRARVQDVVPDLQAVPVYLNGTLREVPPLLTVNGRPATADTELQDNDRVEARHPELLAEVLAALGMPEAGETAEVRFRLGGSVRTLQRPRYRLAVDGLPADAASRVAPGARIEVAPLPPPTVREAIELAPGGTGAGVRVRLNGRLLDLAPPARVLRNGRPARLDDPLQEGDDLELATPVGSQPILADVLARMGLEPGPPAGKSRLVTLVNGAPAEFITPLQDGDEVIVSWE